MTIQEPIEPDCEIHLDGAPVPLAHELRWGLEWIDLRTSDVYQGYGVARGHGEPVIVAPGFLESYSKMHELTGWLERIGYSVFDPGFERTLECPDVLLERLLRRIAAVHEERRRPVRLIGHSLGGSLARAAAARLPAHVEQVITLGSPLHEVRAHPFVVELARMLEVISPSRHRPHAEHQHGATCACELADALAQPIQPEIRRTAIYTRGDGVVDWRTCIENDPAVDVEVEGTHIGLIVNSRAYEAIGRALAPSFIEQL